MGPEEILNAAGAESGPGLDRLMGHWSVRRSVRRGEHLVFPGECETHLYHVLSGTFRIYLPGEKSDFVVGFGYVDTLLCAYPSFIEGAASEYGIQALRNAELCGISRTHFYAVIEENLSLERAWRRLTEEAFLGRIRREVDLLTSTPAERVERLLRRSPHLFQEIPLKYIASYLRMQPETLSRVLGKLKS